MRTIAITFLIALAPMIVLAQEVKKNNASHSKNEIKMNKNKSDQKSQHFMASKSKFNRMSQTYERIINASPEDIFPLLCPSRECDWINGWDCELIYTSTGYAEKDCVFQTAQDHIFGGGVWIFTDFEPNKKVQLVRIMENAMVIHIRITLVDNNDGTTIGKWDEQFTAINEMGNQMLDGMPSEPDTQFLEELNYYLKHGELMKINN